MWIALSCKGISFNHWKPPKVGEAPTTEQHDELRYASSCHLQARWLDQAGAVILWLWHLARCLRWWKRTKSSSRNCWAAQATLESWIENSLDRSSWRQASPPKRKPLIYLKHHAKSFCNILRKPWQVLSTRMHSFKLQNHRKGKLSTPWNAIEKCRRRAWNGAKLRETTLTYRFQGICVKTLISGRTTSKRHRQQHHPKDRDTFFDQLERPGKGGEETKIQSLLVSFGT